MQQFTKGSTIKFYCTLTDVQTLTSPNYLMYFKNRATKEVVAWVQLFATDVSAYKYRYNRFDFAINTYFTGSTDGIWDYAIYEQAGTSTDPTGLNQLETGNIYLNPATTNYTPVKYSGQDNKYKVYNG
jgi:hypothetical protein